MLYIIIFTCLFTSSCNQNRSKSISISLKNTYNLDIDEKVSLYDLKYSSFLHKFQDTLYFNYIDKTNELIIINNIISGESKTLKYQREGPNSFQSEPIWAKLSQSNQIFVKCERNLYVAAFDSETKDNNELKISKHQSLYTDSSNYYEPPSFGLLSNISSDGIIFYKSELYNNNFINLTKFDFKSLNQSEIIVYNEILNKKFKKLGLKIFNFGRDLPLFILEKGNLALYFWYSNKLFFTDKFDNESYIILDNMSDNTIEYNMLDLKNRIKYLYTNDIICNGKKINIDNEEMGYIFEKLYFDKKKKKCMKKEMIIYNINGDILHKKTIPTNHILMKQEYNLQSSFYLNFDNEKCTLLEYIFN